MIEDVKSPLRILFLNFQDAALCAHPGHGRRRLRRAQMRPGCGLTSLSLSRDCPKIASPALRTCPQAPAGKRPPRDLLLQVTRRVKVQTVFSISSARDCPSVPVTCVILEATGGPHPCPLLGQVPGQVPWSGRGHPKRALAHLYPYGLPTPYRHSLARERLGCGCAVQEKKGIHEKDAGSGDRLERRSRHRLEACPTISNRRRQVGGACPLMTWIGFVGLGFQPVIFFPMLARRRVRTTTWTAGPRMTGWKWLRHCPTKPQTFSKCLGGFCAVQYLETPGPGYCRLNSRCHDSRIHTLPSQSMVLALLQRRVTDAST